MESHEKNVSVVGTDLNPTTDMIEMNAKANGIEAAVPKRQLKDLDDLLPYVGDFGWYQRILFLLMIPYSFFFAFVYFGQIFMTVVPEEHWCFVPELGNLSVEARRHLSVPFIDNKYDKCSVYDVNWTSVLQNGTLEPNPEWTVKKCEHKWEFNYSDVPYESIASQQNWVCERDNYPATAQAVFFCGAIAGGFIFGWVADKYGRIPALIGANLSGFVGGLGSVFTNAFWSFCVCRFIVGLAYDNCFVIMYIVGEFFIHPHISEKSLLENSTSVSASAPGAASIKPVPKKAPNRADKGDGFVTVQTRKRRSRKNENRCGKATTEPDVSLRAAKPNTPVYISRLHYTTKEVDIVEYVRQKTRYTPRVQLLESRRNVNFKAFVVRVPNCYLPLVMQEDFWPQDVVFRRFRGQVPQDSTKAI